MKHNTDEIFVYQLDPMDSQLVEKIHPMNWLEGSYLDLHCVIA